MKKYILRGVIIAIAFFILCLLIEILLYRNGIVLPINATIASPFFFLYGIVVGTVGKILQISRESLPIPEPVTFILIIYIVIGGIIGWITGKMRTRS